MPMPEETPCLILGPVTPSRFTVTHRASGKTMGLVVRMAVGGWCFVCPGVGCVEGSSYNQFSEPYTAAVALYAHNLEHVLVVARRCAGEALASK